MHHLRSLMLLIVFSSPVLTKHHKQYHYQNEPRIVGGFPADLASTRFIASLRLTIEEEFFGFGAGHKCGGSLLAEDVVITAAHCLFVYNNGPFDKELRDPCDWTIVLGSYNKNTRETTNAIREVHGVTVHADYDDQSMENDIALLFLNQSVTLTPGVIETVELNDRDVPIGTECQASGWGRIEYGGILADDLQTVNISVVDLNICNATDSYGGEIHDGMLCVGNLDGGKDSCQGDSGGPLICDGLLTGVVSWGYRCAQPNYPGVYTDVNYFREWIQSSYNAGPEVLANCEQDIDPSTENPVSPTAPSEPPPTTEETGSTTIENGSFRLKIRPELVFMGIIGVTMTKMF